MIDEQKPSSDLLSDLHDRYLLLSGRFKSAWTFHQFLKGLNKVFVDQAVDLGTLSFQSIYSELKIASKNLNVASADTATHHLDRAEEELGRRLESLVDIDDQLTPTLLRRFFKRVRNYDARILGQLLKFFLFTRAIRWNDDRQDKTDFLLTRLGELLLERDLTPLERHPHALKDALRGVWQALDGDSPTDATVAESVAGLAALRASMEGIESLEDFHEMGVIQSYRSYKRELGELFFHPSVAVEIVECNLYLAEKVDGLYELEEQRVATEYNKVFDLERGASQLEDALDQELRTFRTKVEDLERSTEAQNVKINQLVSVSGNAKDLIPRLEGLAHSSPPSNSERDAQSLEEPPDEKPKELMDEKSETEPGKVDDSDNDVEEGLSGSSLEPDAGVVDVGALFETRSTEQLDPEGPSPAEDGPLSGPLTGYAESAESPHSTEAEPRPSIPDRAIEDLSPLPDFFGEPLVAREPSTASDLEEGAAEAESSQRSYGDGSEAAQAEPLDVEDWRLGLSAERPEQTLRIRTGYAEQLGQVLRQLLKALERTDWHLAPKLAVQVPEARGLRLEAREVLAYRRLFFPERFDRRLEQFLVEAAGVRMKMRYLAEELVDHTRAADDGNRDVLRAEAQRTVEVASEFEKRCQHFVQEAVHGRRTADAAALQVIWMRLLREYSGLWLLLNRD